MSRPPSSDHITGETLELRTQQDVLEALRPDSVLAPRCVKIHVILLQEEEGVHLVQRGLYRLKAKCKELVFLVTDYEHMALHVTVLASLLAIVQYNLKQLSFSSMDLHGDMAPVLQYMVPLEKLSIHYCRFYLPNDGGSEKSTLSVAAEILRYTQRLVSLELFAYSLKQDAVGFLEAVSLCTTLQKLNCHGMHSRSFGKRGIRALGRLLLGNNNKSSRLREMSVSVDRCACLKPLERGLARNETLQQLDIFRDGWSCDPRLDQQNLQVFRNVLRDSNYTLTKCYIRWNDASRKQQLEEEFQEIEFYIRLNCLGRGALLLRPVEDRPYWWDFILRHYQDDISLIQYVLLQNPPLLT